MMFYGALCMILLEVLLITGSCDRFVTGTDASNTLISDLRAFLDECQKHNMFMILVLFNGAVLRNQGRRA